jgi:rRNA-processing protein FCF1
MPLLRPSVQWALDTNFLLSLAAGLELVSATREIAIEKGIHLSITTTVLAELKGLSRKNDRAGSLAITALKSLAEKWNIEPFVLDESDQAVAEDFADGCLRRELLPVSERNDALVLGEASVKRIPFVISSDGHLLSIEASDLAAICLPMRLPLVSVLHPFQARRALEG